MANEISVSGSLSIYKPSIMAAVEGLSFASGLQFNMTANNWSKGTILVPANLSGTITNATNANPIVITTSAAHNLVTGDSVTISGVLGNTAANGTNVATVLTATTFSIPVAGNGAYTSGGTFTTANGTAIPLGQVTTPHWAAFVNKDPTNSIQLRNGVAGAIFGRLLAGEPALIPLEPTSTPYALALVSACLLEFFIAGQ